MTVTRFAPSPTGLLHLGHAYAAKVAHDLAHEHHGKFLLRQEDIDSSRVRAEYDGATLEDLRWLGLQWDGEILRQSSRAAAYAKAFSTLKKRELVYPCFCTRKQIHAEIDSSMGAPHGASEHLYPRTCLGLDTNQASQRIASGEAHAWRLNAEKAATVHGALSFHDLRFGDITVDASVNGDAILSRKDIGTSYHLAVVVDDEFQEITHVTRGDDLLPSTHIHRQLQAILDYREPTYLHHACVCDENGKRLAKRDEAKSIRQLRDSGLSPVEIFEMAERSLNQ